MRRRGDVSRAASHIENSVVALETGSIEKIENAPDGDVSQMLMVRLRDRIVGPAGVLEVPE